MNEEQFKQMLASVLGIGGATKAAGTPSVIDWYQAGGLFGTTEGEQMLVNALVGPMGIESYLPWRGTRVEKKFTDALTGTSESGSNQSTVCGDCKTIDLSACTQFYPLGRFCAQTPEEQADNLGLMEQEASFVRNIFGDITGPGGEVLIPRNTMIEDRFYIDIRMVGYLLRKLNGTMIWNGDPVNNNKAYKEFKGLEMIVNTGKFDALTELSCPALDSFIMNIAGNNWTADGAYAVRNWFARQVQQFMKRASGAGLDWATANMVIVMTENMWDTIARLYACAGLDLCSSGVSDANISINQSADAQLDRYHTMLNTKKLSILGREYQVVVDTLMTETDNGDGTFTSDIYFLTLGINGEDVLYGEYQDFSQTFAAAKAELARLFGSGNSDVGWTDGGRYMVLSSQVRGCFDVQAILKPRLVARAPFLSGRITNAVAVPLSEGFPDSDTFTGGRTAAPLEFLYDTNQPVDGFFFNPNR